MNNNVLLRLQVRLQTAWMNLRDSERGQAVVEYVGIGFVVVAIIGLIIGVLNNKNTGNSLGTSILGKITNAVNKVEPGH
jgi:hypothetical protein